MTRRPQRRRAATEPAIAWQRSPATPWTAAHVAALFGVVAIALALRLFRVEAWAFVGDEVAVWQGITRGADVPIGGGEHHPLFLWLLRTLIDAGVLPSTDEEWLRLPSVFAGVTTVPLLALAAWRLVAHAGTALAAAALLAVHPWHLAASQSASPAAFALLLTVAAIAAVPTVGSRAAWLRWVLTAAAALGAVASHPGGWLVLPLVAVPAAAWRWPPSTAAGITVVVGVLVAAPLLPLAGLPWAGWTWQGEAGQTAPPLAAFAAAARWPVLLFVAAVPFTLRPLPAAPTLAFAAAAGSLAAVSFAGVSLAPDAMLPLLPMALVLAAQVGMRVFTAAHADLSADGRPGTFGAAAPLLALLAWLLVTSALHATAYQGERPPWRLAREFAAAARADKRGVLVAAASGWPSLTYYLRPNHWRGLRIDPHPGMRVERFDVGNAVAAIDELLAGARGEVVFVMLRQDEMCRLDAAAEAGERLRASFRLLRVLPTACRDGAETVYVWRRLEI